MTTNYFKRDNGTCIFFNRQQQQNIFNKKMNANVYFVKNDGKLFLKDDKLFIKRRWNFY